MRQHRGLLPVLVLIVVLSVTASGALALPLDTIPTETIVRPMTGGLNHEFAWSAGYDIGFSAATGNFDIGLRINLIGADPGDTLRTTWERGIENTWSHRFSLTDNDRAHGVVFDVMFVDANPHHTVTVHSGTGNANMLNWYTENPSGWPQDRQGLLVAHEAGHMVGNFDEYPGGAVNPNGSFGNVPDSLMGSLLSDTLYDRHFQFVVDWAAGQEATQTVGAPVPEPASILLLISGATGLISVAWKRRRRP
jgi:hypothetical protein